MCSSNLAGNLEYHHRLIRVRTCGIATKLNSNPDLDEVLAKIPLYSIERHPNHKFEDAPLTPMFATPLHTSAAEIPAFRPNTAPEVSPLPPG